MDVADVQPLSKELPPPRERHKAPHAVLADGGHLLKGQLVKPSKFRFVLAPQPVTEDLRYACADERRRRHRVGVLHPHTRLEKPVKRWPGDGERRHYPVAEAGPLSQ